MKKFVLFTAISLTTASLFAFVNPRSKSWSEYERECWLNEEEADYDYWATSNEVPQDGHCDLEAIERYAKENGFKSLEEYTDWLFGKDIEKSRS